MEERFIVTTDKEKLNIDLIYSFLKYDSYWAKGRSREKVERSIHNSLCFGLYTEKGKMAGFARVVTDYAIFAWIMDVFVVEEFRGNGFGKMIMKEIMDHPDLQGLQRWGLCTDDAHKLYEKYGFKNIEKPGIFMEKIGQ